MKMDELNNKYNLLEKIKSKYILKKIFDNLQKRKSLNIIRYNKIIQERLDIDLYNYIESQQIEIEIIPSSMRRKGMKKFIIISNKEDEPYCHIYFNDNNTEIKKNYIIKQDNVSKIKIKFDYKFNSFSKLFNGRKIIK